LKQFTVILFSALLMWAQIVPLPAASPVRPCCNPAAISECAGCCGNAGCCEQSPSDSRPAPAVPAQSRTQNPLPTLALAVVTLALPENETISSPPVSISLLKAADSPLYAKNCALLL
jgi:hypothetical protein